MCIDLNIMRTFFSLNSCNTCQRIYRELDLPSYIEFVNIKEKPLTTETLERLKKLSGSYEALFSKRAQLYKKLNLHERQLSENDYKVLILEHYTFLKRPVLVYDEHIFIGNSKAVVADAKKWLDEH
ncbi:MAG: ArsC/Spx/MgsR family protein [Bacteroidota bacterium]|nr:ArsC/Spx/MgsR family protein [Bacteroidota bacterium]